MFRFDRKITMLMMMLLPFMMAIINVQSTMTLVVSIPSEIESNTELHNSFSAPSLSKETTTTTASNNSHYRAAVVEFNPSVPFERGQTAAHRLANRLSRYLAYIHANGIAKGPDAAVDIIVFPEGALIESPQQAQHIPDAAERRIPCTDAQFAGTPVQKLSCAAAAALRCRQYINASIVPGTHELLQLVHLQHKHCVRS